MTTTAIQIEWSNQLRPIAEKYDALSNEDLERSLCERFSMTVENIVHLAVILRLCVHREMDLSRIPTLASWKPALMRVGTGQLLPEIMQRFYSQRGVFRKMAALPVDEQHRIAADQPIRVVSLVDGGIDHRTIAPSKLTEKQAHQVFAADHIRDDSEQRTWLEQKAAAAPPVPAGPYVIDQKKGVVRITRAPLQLTCRQLAEIVAKLS